MKTKIQKWGNSLGVRLPKTITEAKSLQEGAGVTVSIQNNQIVIEPCEDISLEDLLATVTTENLHAETTWGKANGNEAW